MPITFETSGPHPLPRKDGEVLHAGLSTLWASAAEMSAGLGVYIILSEEQSELRPWYVGKTDRGFLKRLNTHFQSKKLFRTLAVTCPSGDLQVIFIARTTPGGKLVKAKSKRLTVVNGVAKRRKVKPMKSIDRLEFDLIRDCLKTNPKLLNKSHRVFQEGFDVPGFLGPRTMEKSRAARALRTITGK